MAARLPRPQAIAGLARQRLDEAGERLPRALLTRARLLQARLSAAGDRLTPRLLVHHLARERALLASPRVTPNPALLRARLSAARASLAAGFRLAEGLSPQAVLARGFTLVRLPDGAVARHAADAAAAAQLRIVFADGEVLARPAGSSQPRSTPGAEPPAGGPQGRLF
jgi:exodeoxyribonuclease VII large subunit